MSKEAETSSSEVELDEADLESNHHEVISSYLDYDDDESDCQIIPNSDIPDTEPIKPLFDPPPAVSDTFSSFRPPNWTGLVAAIQNEPIDPIQLGKDIFDETKGSEKKYKCLLNGLEGKPFRLDLQSLYQRRTEWINRLGGDNYMMVQLYDFNVACMFKMDMDRRAFNNVASIINQNIFYKTVNENKILDQYNFNPNRMREVIFFTPVEVDEYKSTNSVEVLDAVIALNLTDQKEIAKQMVSKTYELCIKPEFRSKMHPTPLKEKTVLMNEFFVFLKRILFQSFGLPQKFIGMSEEKLMSGLPTGDYPFERATATILVKLTRKTLESICRASSSDNDELSDDSQQPTSISKTIKGRGRKRTRE